MIVEQNAIRLRSAKLGVIINLTGKRSAPIEFLIAGIKRCGQGQ